MLAGCAGEMPLCARKTGGARMERPLGFKIGRLELEFGSEVEFRGGLGVAKFRAAVAEGSIIPPDIWVGSSTISLSAIVPVREDSGAAAFFGGSSSS